MVEITEICLKIYCFLLLFLFACQLKATSCTGTTDRIIANCQSDQCDELFFVKEIPNGEECGRRPVIVSLPAWAKAVIEYEIKLLNAHGVSAVFELSMKNRSWWKPSENTDLNSYILNKGDELNKSEIYSELIFNINQKFSNVYQHWKIVESQKRMQMIKFKTFWWLGLCFSLILMLTFMWLLVQSIASNKLGLAMITFGFFVLAFLISTLSVDDKNSFASLFLLILPGLVFLNLLAIIRMLKLKLN